MEIKNLHKFKQNIRQCNLAMMFSLRDKINREKSRLEETLLLIGLKISLLEEDRIKKKLKSSKEVILVHNRKQCKKGCLCVVAVLRILSEPNHQSYTRQKETFQKPQLHIPHQHLSRSLNNPIYILQLTLLMQKFQRVFMENNYQSITQLEFKIKDIKM